MRGDTLARFQAYAIAPSEWMDELERNPRPRELGSDRGGRRLHAFVSLGYAEHGPVIKPAKDRI